MRKEQKQRTIWRTGRWALATLSAVAAILGCAEPEQEFSIMSRLPAHRSSIWGRLQQELDRASVLTQSMLLPQVRRLSSRSGAIQRISNCLAESANRTFHRRGAALSADRRGTAHLDSDALRRMCALYPCEKLDASSPLANPSIGCSAIQLRIHIWPLVVDY